MRLLELLLEASRKDILVNKIVFSEGMADQLLNDYGKKRSIIYGNILQDWYKRNAPKGYKELMAKDDRIPNIFKELFDGIDDLLTSNNKPQDLFQQIKKIKVPSTNEIEIGGRALPLPVWRDRFIIIRDYVDAVTPIPQLQSMSFEEAMSEANEWHNSAEASGKKLQLGEDQDLIHQFDDDYYWVDLNTSHCTDEGDAMGHCANTDAETLLSLRDPEGEPHVTVAFNYDGTYRQMKGKQNKKPIEKYHEYCEWLFTNGGEYQLKAYKSEYQKESDLTIDDLPEIYDDVIEKYPELEGGINWDKLDEIMTEEGNEAATQYFNETLDTDIEGFYGGDTDVVILQEEIVDRLSDLMEPLNDAKEYIERISDAIENLYNVAYIYYQKDADSIMDALIRYYNIEYDSDNVDSTRDSWENIFIMYCQYLLKNEKDKFKSLLKNVDSKFGGYVKDFIKNSKVDPTMELFITDFVRDSNPQVIKKIVEEIYINNLNYSWDWEVDDEKILMLLLSPLFTWDIKIDFEDNQMILTYLYYLHMYMDEEDMLPHMLNRYAISDEIYQMAERTWDSYDDETYDNNLYKHMKAELITHFGEKTYQKAIELYENVFEKMDREAGSYIDQRFGFNQDTQEDLFGDTVISKSTKKFEELTTALENKGFI